MTSVARESLAPTLAVPRATPTRAQLLNRELSWLDFDRRVLELAADPDVPLLQRVAFCAIASSNLDEFFAVRMAGLSVEAALGIARTSPDGKTRRQTLGEARNAVVALQAAQDRLWLDELRPALAAAGIHLAAVEECRPRELRALAKRFEREIEPLLTPIAVGAAAPFPHIPSLALSIGVVVQDGAEQRFVRVNVPAHVPRFLDLGARGVRVAVEDAILHFLPTVLGDVQARTVFRVTRDSDVSIASDADDLLEALETELRRRRFGNVVRLEVQSSAPPELVQMLVEELRIGPDQVYESAAPIALAGAAELAELDRPDLKLEPWRPVTARPFATRTPAELLERVRRRDLLAHHPYDAFETSVEQFVGTARDPKVAALKATVYRTSVPSMTVASLVETAEEGKETVCLVELKARFEERRNIEWSRALERAGVHVVYGVPDLKVHAKLALIVRREAAGMRRYVHIGTGNYHASNASAYEDLSLFTADEEIAADVADVFNAVTGHVRPTVFRKLLVGPWFLREGLLHEIERVRRAAEAGGTARIRLKVNALADPEIAEGLYEASAAGVTVEAVTRGICVLRPQVAGVSERITVRSVLGRFLEHSRVLSFEAGPDVTTWLGSADLMPRNLDRRIEVLVPVEDARLRARISGIFDALLADTQFSWELGADGTWSRRRPAAGERAVSAQDVLMGDAVKRTKKHSAA